MALRKCTDSERAQSHKTSFVPVLVLIIIAVAAAGCASAATPVSTPEPATNTPHPTDTPQATNTPVPATDISQQVVAAVQEPGLITVVNTTVDSRVGDEIQQETGRAWLDFPGQRVRIEGWLDEEPSTISVVVDGTIVEYSRERDQIDEYPVRFFGMSLEEARDTLPEHLSNPALLGLVSLSDALVHTRGEFRPAGDGQWQGRPATLWKADFTGGLEGYDHAYHTVYLEPDTFRPLGQEVRFTSQDAQAPELTMSVTYRLEFLSLEDLSWRVFQPGRGFHPDEPEPTPLPTAGPPPPPLPTVPTSDLPSATDVSSLLRVMEKLPASFGEKGVWFADYAGAWEVAGLPPRPTTVEGYLALSEEEQEAYQDARRGLMLGPHQLAASLQYAQKWEELLGFSGFAVSRAVAVGRSESGLFGTAYLEADFDRETLRQSLLDLGYREESVNDGTYYAIRDDRDQDLDHPMREAGVLAQMNRVFLADGILAASPDTDPIVDVVAATSGSSPVLAEDPVLSRLASSLGQSLSGTLLPRSAVLEPHGRLALSHETYERPEDWGEIHQWEALGAGYTVVDGQPWWAISLFYPDPAAAEADVEEIMDRMNGYRTAITPLFIPSMSQPMREVTAKHPYPISESCASLTPVHTSDDTASVLTVWCQAEEPETGFMTWQGFLEYRDLGFLLP